MTGHLTYLYAMPVVVFPSVLKGFSLGIHFFKKRGLVFFWGKKRYESYERCIGENSYRGKNQEQ